MSTTENPVPTASTSTVGSAGSTDSHASRPPADVRGFWRVLLAVIAPLPMVFQGVYNLLSPSDGDAAFADTVAALAEHEDRIPLLQWIQMPFALLLPASFAVVWAARRGAPRLTTAGALVTLTGICAGFFALGGPFGLADLVVQHDVDVTAAAEIDTLMAEHPIALIGGLLFILAITIGLLLLGLALWRSRVAPAWMGIALALGGITHPFMPGHVAAGIGLLVAAVGFAGASVALLRMSNDEFDLPPFQPVPGSNHAAPMAAGS